MSAYGAMRCIAGTIVWAEGHRMLRVWVSVPCGRREALVSSCKLGMVTGSRLGADSQGSYCGRVEDN